MALFFLIWPILEARSEIREGKKVPTWANSALVKERKNNCSLNPRWRIGFLFFTLFKRHLMGLHLHPVPVPQFRRPRIQYFLDKYRISSISILGHSFFWHLRMGKLFEGFEIFMYWLWLVFEREDNMYLRKYGISDEINSAFFITSVILTFCTGLSSIKERVIPN